VPGKNIVLPSHPSLVSVKDADMEHLRKSYLKNSLKSAKENRINEIDVEFLSEETQISEEEIREILKENKIVIE
jgi:NACalpha-BTF3-like transcription factor